MIKFHTRYDLVFYCIFLLAERVDDPGSHSSSYTFTRFQLVLFFVATKRQLAAFLYRTQMREKSEPNKIATALLFAAAIAQYNQM